LPTASPTATPVPAVCGAFTTPPATFAHVIWIWMENHSYAEVIGNPDAPYINEIAESCGVATNFHNTTHLSLPNYLAAVTGLPKSALGVPYILDCFPTEGCRTPSDSLFAQAPS